MTARGYALGILASVAVHALALTLLALAWRADFQRRDPAAGNAPIPVWLVEDKKAAPTDIVPASGQLPPPPAPELPTPEAATKPVAQHAPAPRREATSEPAPEPAARHRADVASLPLNAGIDPVRLPRAPTPSGPAVTTGQPDTADAPPSTPLATPLPEPAPADAGKTAGAPIEREYRALSRPEPAYPHQALARGIEGYVVLEFTVTAAGTTRDLRVLEASPVAVFDAAALAAARQFRYQPRIQAGAPVDVPGVRSRIRFEIRPR
jgi:protein TonB